MKNDWALLMGGIGLGAGLAYLLDPSQGRRRRAYLGDQAVRAAHAVEECTDTTFRDLGNRTRGVVAEARSRLRPEEVTDRVLVERVRAAMGRAISHPHAVHVTANAGRVTLTGPVLADEMDRLMATVSRVRGVQSVENRLDVHQQPGNIPGLQGGSGRLARYSEAQANWPPATRLLAGTAGAALAVAGVGLLFRSATNTEHLTGAGAGRRAIDLRRTINIAAPVEEVYAFCSDYANFPRFMSHVREVRDNGQGYSHWVVDGPAGVPVSWDAVVTRQIPSEVLAWKSVEGAAIRNAGFMRFDRNPDGTTRLDIHLSYNPPGGAMGHAVATPFGRNPEQQMEDDLVRLKSIIEEGKARVPGGGEVTRDRLAA